MQVYELIWLLEQIASMTERNSLEVGFNHSVPTKDELQTRLTEIKDFCITQIERMKVN